MHTATAARTWLRPCPKRLGGAPKNASNGAREALGKLKGGRRRCSSKARWSGLGAPMARGGSPTPTRRPSCAALGLLPASSPRLAQEVWATATAKGRTTDRHPQVGERARVRTKPPPLAFLFSLPRSPLGLLLVLVLGVSPCQDRARPVDDSEQRVVPRVPSRPENRDGVRARRAPRAVDGTRDSKARGAQGKKTGAVVFPADGKANSKP